MVRFYDPGSVAEQADIVGLLRRAGIEFFLRPDPAETSGVSEIFVAEEDIPRAEALLNEIGPSATRH